MLMNPSPLQENFTSQQVSQDQQKIYNENQQNIISQNCQKSKSLSEFNDIFQQKENRKSIFFLQQQISSQHFLSMEQKTQNFEQKQAQSSKNVKNRLRPSLKIQTNHILRSQNLKLSQKDDEFTKKYEILKEIGQGQFAQAVMVTDKELSRIQQEPVYFVAKDITIDNNEEGIMKEWTILKELTNQYIIKPQEIFIRQNFNKITMILEYFPGQNLYTIIKQHVQFSAVEYLHNSNIIHRDISLENVLFSLQQEEIRLIDFGISLKMQENQQQQEYFSPTSNPMCQAPEVQLNQKITNKVDMYAIGIIFLSLVKFKVIQSKKIKYHLQTLNEALSEEMKNLKMNELIMLLLHTNPEQRISAKDALQFYFK